MAFISFPRLRYVRIHQVEFANHDLCDLFRDQAREMDALLLVLTLAHIEFLGQDAAAKRVLAIGLLEIIVQFFGHSQVLFYLGVTLLGAAKEQAQSHHAAGNRAAKALGTADAHGEAGGHGDHLFGHIQRKIAADGGHDRLGAEKPAPEELLGIFFDLLHAYFIFDVHDLMLLFTVIDQM